MDVLPRKKEKTQHLAWRSAAGQHAGAAFTNQKGTRRGANQQSTTKWKLQKKGGEWKEATEAGRSSLPFW